MTVTPEYDVCKYLNDIAEPSGSHLVTTYPHPDLITDPLAPRLKVDVGETGFFAGREFRTFWRMTIPNMATKVLRVTVAENILLQSVSTVITSGHLDLETRTGGTQGGTFGVNVPVFAANNMTTSPTMPASVTIATGGTHTGGTVLDVLVDKTEKTANKSQSVGAFQDDVRGIAPGVYYFVFKSLDADDVTGIFKARWQTSP